MTMTDQSDQPVLAGLYSSQILKYVVQALDIEDDVLESRTARRFSSGESVNEYNRGQILEALGQALIDRGMVPEALDALPHGASTAMAVGMAVGLMGERWDHLMATVQSRGTADVDVAAVGRRFLRLVAVDLALRLFALHRLTDLPLPDAEPPSWVRENGGGRVLRHCLRRSGLTRRALADRLGASYTTVDNWLDGKNRPSHMLTSLPWLVSLRRRGADRTSGSFEWELRRQLTFARLAELLAALTGRDAVFQLTGTAVRLARTLSESIGFSAFPGRSCRPGGTSPVALRHSGGFRTGSVVVAGQDGIRPRMERGIARRG